MALPTPAADSGRFTRDDKIVLGLVLGTVVLMNVPYGQYALYPFKLFSTWIHESFHGLATLVVGGSVEEVKIFQDTSGVTLSLLSTSTLPRAVVSSMGYLGTAIAGAVLLFLRHRPRAQRWALGVLALAMVATLAFWIRNLFGFATVAVLAAGIAVLALRATDHWASIATSFLASQACINAVLDIRVLFGFEGHSDAYAMTQIVGLWPWFWASLWMALSALLFWAAWRRRPAAKRV